MRAVAVRLRAHRTDHLREATTVSVWLTGCGLVTLDAKQLRARGDLILYVHVPELRRSLDAEVGHTVPTSLRPNFADDETILTGGDKWQTPCSSY